MRHKAILLTKQKKAKKEKGREVIGLIGTHHGVGVTHTGLMLAFYLGEERRKKIAFIECNRHHDFTLIKNAYEWEQVNSDSFSFHQITCFPDMSTDSLSKIFSEDYGNIILDFGTDFTTNKEELLRCSFKIVICGRSEWDRQKLIRFLAELKEIKSYDTWFYCIPQANDKTISKMKNEVKHEVYAIPECGDPTRLNGSSIRMFQEIL